MPLLQRDRSSSTATYSSLDDPLTRALQPPPDESPAEKEARIRAEKEAKKVSDEIDEELKTERKRERGRLRPVRVLLLGQSESGKSTTLKNFQIHYAPLAWREERLAWRAVIQLNLIRSVALVLDIIASLPRDSQINTSAPASRDTTTPAALLACYTPLLFRLQVAERILQRQLSPGDGEEAGDYRTFLAGASPSLSATPSPSHPQEFFVRTTWKSRFLRRASSAGTPVSTGSVIPWRVNPTQVQNQTRNHDQAPTSTSTRLSHGRSTPTLRNSVESGPQQLRSSFDFGRSGSTVDFGAAERYVDKGKGKEKEWEPETGSGRKASLALDTNILLSNSISTANSKANFSPTLSSSDDQDQITLTPTQSQRVESLARALGGISPVGNGNGTSPGGYSDTFSPLAISAPSPTDHNLSQTQQHQYPLQIHDQASPTPNPTSPTQKSQLQSLPAHLPSPTQILCASLSEMKSLWDDPAVRKVIRMRRMGVNIASVGGGLAENAASFSTATAKTSSANISNTSRPRAGSFNLQNHASLIPGSGSVSVLQSGTRIEDVPGFFLPDVERIAEKGYEPSDDDVMRARLRTMGVQEHRFTFEKGLDQGREWRVIDVGGSRSQRTSWLSFFDEMDAIIFLAPVSCFDEVLAEDPRMNRLEDSITLWRSLCRSPLLARVQLVLFLNKIDILRRKIADGIRVAKHVTSFADRSNDADTVCRYFKHKFKDIQRQYSPQPRPYYVYLTSVTDTKATGITLGIVREGILRTNLQRADFI